MLFYIYLFCAIIVIALRLTANGSRKRLKEQRTESADPFPGDCRDESPDEATQDELATIGNGMTEEEWQEIRKESLNLANLVELDDELTEEDEMRECLPMNDYNVEMSMLETIEKESVELDEMEPLQMDDEMDVEEVFEVEEDLPAEPLRTAKDLETRDTEQVMADLRRELNESKDRSAHLKRKLKKSQSKRRNLLECLVEAQAAERNSKMKMKQSQKDLQESLDQLALARNQSANLQRQLATTILNATNTETEMRETIDDLQRELDDALDRLEANEKDEFESLEMVVSIPSESEMQAVGRQESQDKTKEDDRVAELQNQLESLKRQNEMLQTSLQTLQVAQSELEQQNRDLKDQFEERESDLTDELDWHVKTLEKCNSQLEADKARLIHLQRELDTRHTTEEKTEEVLDKIAQSTAKILVEKCAIIEKLEAELEERNKEKEAWEKDRDKLLDTVSYHQRTVEWLSQEKDRSEAALKEKMERQFDEKYNELVHSYQTMLEEKAQLIDINEQCLRDVNDLQSELSRSANEQKRLEAQLHKIRLDNQGQQEWQVQKATMQQTLNELRDEKAVLAEAVGQYEHTNVQAIKRERELKDRLASLTAQLKTCEEERDGLRERLQSGGSHDKMTRQLEQLDSEERNLQQELSRMRSDKQKLVKAMAEWQRDLVKCQTYSKSGEPDREDVRECLVALANLIDDKERLMIKLDKSIADAETKLADVHKKADICRTKLGRTATTLLSFNPAQ